MLDGKSLFNSASQVGSENASVFTDLNGLNAIKQQGRDNSEDALRSVARQFESMFVNMMMKSMRSANAVFSEGNMLQSHEGDTYQKMYDDQLSVSLTQGSGMGLADILFQQMQQQYLRTDSGRDASSLEQNIRIAQPLEIQQGSTPRDNPGSVVAVQERDVTHADDESIGEMFTNFVEHTARKIESVSEDVTATVFETPIEFVRSLLPQVQKAAEELGIDPRALIAQAALETGWGSRMIEGGEGEASFNLFGIKASSGWNGDAVSVPTVEFENGAAQRKRALFRAYESFADSAMDYAKLIKNSPRYQAAMNATGNIGQYWEELQSAGYATDPQYAKKLNGILHGSTLKNALGAVDTLK